MSKMESNQDMREEEYTPRPMWQVWLARLGLAAFLIFLAIWYFGLFGGGA